MTSRCAPFASLSRPELPPLLRRPGRLAHRQLDADRRRDVAHRAAHRQRRLGRPDRGAAVPADPAVRRLGRPARRPHAEAPRCSGHAGADGAARRSTLWALTVERRVEVWMVYALFFVRGTVNAVDNPARQSFVSRWSAPTGSSTRCRSTASIVHTARIVGPAAAGARDRAARRRPVLPAQRALVRAMLVALRAMDPSAAAHARRSPRARRGQLPLARCATCARRRRCGSRSR